MSSSRMHCRYISIGTVCVCSSLSYVFVIPRTVAFQAPLSMGFSHWSGFAISFSELKEKHTLEQDELFCCVIINSGIKQKMFVIFSSRVPDPFLLLRDARLPKN